MAPKRQLYETLGILRSSSEGDIRSAYKRRALETHPDKGGDHNSFLKVISAFTVLSDPVERAKYDAQLQLRKDRDGTTVQASKASKASTAKATRVKKGAEQKAPERPGRPEQKHAADASTKRTTHSTHEDGEKKAARNEGATETSEATLAWQRLLQTPEDQWEDSLFQDFSWRFLHQILEIGSCGIKRSSIGQGDGPKKSQRKKRFKAIADVPTVRKPFPKLQRHIRKVGPRSFCCVMTFRFLEISSSSSSLAETIDWHICLTRFQQMTERILDEGGDDAYAQIHEALQSALKDHVDQGGRMPYLKFSLKIHLRSACPGQKHQEQRAFRTPDLKWVLQAHSKICRVMRESDEAAVRETMKQLKQESMLMAKERKCLAAVEVKQRLLRCRALKAQQQKEQARQRLEQVQRRRRLLQRLKKWKRTFKLPKGLPEGLDAAFVDYGDGKERCCWAILDGASCTGPMRPSPEEATTDLTWLRKIYHAKGPQMALQEATRLETETMLLKFRKQIM